jgi:hypothetical protein
MIFRQSRRRGGLPDILPVETGRLIQALDQEYPHRCPPPGFSLEDIHRYAGKRELIDNLMLRWNAPGEDASPHDEEEMEE